MKNCSTKNPIWLAAKAAGEMHFMPSNPCRNGHLSLRRVNGFDCVECQREHNKKNIERSRECGRKSYAKHREKRRLESAAYHKNRDKDALRAYQKERREKNRDKINAYARNYYAVNIENERARCREKRIIYAETNKRYREAHRLEHNIASAKRRARMRQAASVKASEVRALFRAQRGKCAYCRSKITIDDAHLDHIIPLAMDGLHVASNLQWLCVPCNLSKGARHPAVFARQCGLLI